MCSIYTLFYIFGEIDNFKSSTDGRVADDLETNTDILRTSRTYKQEYLDYQSVIVRSVVDEKYLKIHSLMGVQNRIPAS